jgi:lipopolysaccharide/colanic/teichoic acid biosynthesis glycosyltransferase
MQEIMRIKRIFDLSLTLIALLVLFPLMLLTAVAIVCDSRGGIFYKQLRVGKNNKDFYLYKFRTMHTRSDLQGLLTVGDRDFRITKLGYFLRKTKWDELPQLFNILKGDMSIVGPRPEVRKYVDLYTQEQMRVLTVLPGLTDYASIEYIHENSILEKSANPEQIYINEIMPAKLQLNFKYIDNQSLFVDVKIIIKTIKHILMKVFG